LYTTLDCTTCYSVIPDGDGPGWRGLRRGLWVRHYETADGLSRIGFVGYEVQDGAFVETGVTIGWVRADAVTGDVRRHVFHLHTTGKTEERWRHEDEGD